MSLKWSSSICDAGILRKSEQREKKEELFIFGYSCKLFRDDEKALHIDQGKHLIPWMGDESLKIDRYDARGALHELSPLEAPAGGYDWRVELTRGELDVEQLCDEERYRALFTDEDEEEMYKEEELKRLHAAGYGQVGFDYDVTQETSPVTSPTEVDEPFTPTPALLSVLPPDTVLPETQKLNAIVEKTAKFIASQGAQMEILLRAKQADNSQFQFLNKDSPLHPYYMSLTQAIRDRKYPPEQKPELISEAQYEEHDEYLHPSLGATIFIESAPSIPSIHYRRSADCDYTMLISKIKGEEIIHDEAEDYETPLAPGELPPPGTRPLRLPEVPEAHQNPAEIARAPVMYTQGKPIDYPDNSTQAYYQQYAAYYQQYSSENIPAPVPQVTNLKEKLKLEPKINTPPAPVISTGLSLMTNYNSATDTDSDFDDNSSLEGNEQSIAIPPDDMQVIVTKMAAYVARNGDEFADIVRARNDTRFGFLDPSHVFHPYYKKLMLEKRVGDKKDASSSSGKRRSSKKPIAPVSFSIKKMKEPDPVLPKPALPYESSSDGESEEKDEKITEAVQENPEKPMIPPVVIYRLDPNQDIQRTDTNQEQKIENPKPVQHIDEYKKPITEEKPQERIVLKHFEATEKVVPSIERNSRNYERRKRRTESRSKSASYEPKRPRSPERRYERASKNERMRRKRKPESEVVISIEENSEHELIDLTDDLSDSRADGDTEKDRVKQLERRRRAAEFMKRVGVDPAAASLPHNTLASAMVDTLESLRRKREIDEDRRRRHDRRRHRQDYYDDTDERSHRKSKRRRNRYSEEEDECETSRKKSHKHDKKHSTSSKRSRMEHEEPSNSPAKLNIDLIHTLKELRSSPTLEFGLLAGNSPANKEERTMSRYSSESDLDNTTESSRRRGTKEFREYSEGEWASTDSLKDSPSTFSRESE